MRGIAIILSLLALGCVRTSDVFVADVDSMSWGANQKVGVVYSNGDTTGRYDIDLLINYAALSDTYFDIFVTTITPDSMSLTEKVDIRVDAATIDRDFKPHEIRVPYRRNAVLARAGDYRFEFAPSKYMEGVRAVGVVFNKK